MLNFIQNSIFFLITWNILKLNYINWNDIFQNSFMDLRDDSHNKLLRGKWCSCWQLDKLVSSIGIARCTYTFNCGTGMKRKYERDTHVVWQELIHISMKYTVNFISPFYKNLANVPYIKHSVKYWRFSKGIIVFARMRFFFLILIHLLFIIALIVSGIKFEILSLHCCFSLYSTFIKIF